jgi:hypothetical protein
MKDLLNNLGLSDGDGNVSHTRLINVLVAICWLGSKFYNARMTHQPITWDTNDLALLGAIGGISIGKTIAEKSADAPPAPAGK